MPGPRAARRPTTWLRASGSHVGAPFVRVPIEQETEERRLLSLGLTLKEVAALTGTTPRRLEERSRLLYQIALPAAFRSRIDREGMPDRLRVTPEFGNWFTGLFDGEGHFVISLRGPRQFGNWELQLGLNVYLRDDDAEVLRHVHDALGGLFRPSSKNNVAYWRLRGIANLAEIAVPLFERYRLRSKKAEEFELFRRLVLQRYMATLGGKRRGVPLGNVDEIKAAVLDLRARRRYGDRSSWRLLEAEGAYRGISFTAA